MTILRQLQADAERVDETLAEVDALPEVPTLRPVDLADYPSRDVPAQQFVIDKLLPRGVVTLLAGHGGAGKSQLALIMAAHVASGYWWNGEETQLGPVLLVSLEDDANTVLRRLKKITTAFSLDAAAIEERLQVLDGSHTAGLLMVDDRELGFHDTALMQAMRGYVPGHCLVIVDNASDAFGGNENDRRQVRQFVRTLAQIARDNDAAMMLLAHIDKAAAKYGPAGNSYSGSTAWHNSARSRLALVLNDGQILLKHEKHNYSAGHDDIVMHWADGVLCAGEDPNQGAADDDALQKDVEDVMKAVRHALAEGRTLPTGRGTHSTAWHVLCEYPKELPERLHKKSGRASVFAALSALVSSKRLEIAEYQKADRHTGERYVLPQ